MQGNEVLIMRSGNKKMSQLIYEQIPYTFIDIQESRYTPLASDRRYRRQPFFRRASQVKLYQEPTPTTQRKPETSKEPKSIQLKDLNIPNQNKEWFHKKNYELNNESHAETGETLDESDKEDNTPKSNSQRQPRARNNILPPKSRKNRRQKEETKNNQM